MKTGDLLYDTERGEGRFRVHELLASGKSYQIVLAHDTHLDDKLVCIKAIEYESDQLGNSDYIAGRRQALRAELDVLALSSHLLPEPLDWLELDDSPAGQPPEPLLVCEYQHGDTLHEWIHKRHPQGMPVDKALALFRKLTLFADDVHAEGYILRDFDPRHVIVGLDEVLHFVGTGNAVKRGESMNVFKMNPNPAYTAPEIRRELSGKMVRPACDVYSLGCLLSFLVTGVEPRERPEAPLDVDAYDRLKEELPHGVRMLIARCLQPLAQKRFARASELAEFCSVESLPQKGHKDFGLIDLPTPWSGPEGVDNRATRSKLSAGPLITVKNDGAPTTKSPPTEPETPSAETALAERPEDAVDKPRSKALIALLALGILFLLVVVAAIVGSVVMAVL